MGRRYGGLKQLEGVGPAGETLMDYSLYDAVRAGFGRVVFVIRPDMEGTFHELIGRRYERRIPVAYVYQRLEALPAGFTVPAGRTKPWGTGHAVLAAADAVHEPFSAVNADDFYGSASFAAMHAFLQSPQAGTTPSYAMVGYALRHTVPDSGRVARAVCRCGSDGWLQDIVETIGIERHGSGARQTDDSGRALQEFTGDELVSMNLWGFLPSFFDDLRGVLVRFLQQHGRSTDAELHLPAVVQDALHGGRARIRVLTTTSTWCGITNPRDKAKVTEFVAGLVAHGEYPPMLWG
jgi:NDP-sugar pyrophosphorylase family protein